MAAYVGQEAPAWPLTQQSFTQWAAASGMAAEDASAAWQLYAPVADPRQKWYQIGTELTLFCGLRATVAASAKTVTEGGFHGIHSPPHGSHRLTPRGTPHLSARLARLPEPLHDRRAVYVSRQRLERICRVTNRQTIDSTRGRTSTWGDTKFAAEGTDVYLTWGQTAATTAMRVSLSADALAVGERMRASLIEFARTATLGGEWQPYPAVCEVGTDGLGCSTQNRHAQACDVFDKTLGRKFDVALG